MAASFGWFLVLLQLFLSGLWASCVIKCLGMVGGWTVSDELKIVSYILWQKNGFQFVLYSTSS